MRKQLTVPACLACLVCLTTAGMAWADLVGTWKTERNESFTISYRDKQHIRMEAGPDAYILVSGDKVYMVNRTKGKWKAVEMDEMSGMMKMFGKGPVNAKAIEDHKPHFEPTGRKETIAGYKGGNLSGHLRRRFGPNAGTGDGSERPSGCKDAQSGLG